MTVPKKIVGRREVVNFPELGLFDVVAKMDTGAYRGTLHCSNFRVLQREGQKYVEFVPLDPTHKNFKHEPVTFKTYKRVWVRASTGHNQKRYVIETDIMVHGKTYQIEVTLSDRQSMRNPVLIGRKFLRKKFLVDVDRVADGARR